MRISIKLGSRSCKILCLRNSDPKLMNVIFLPLCEKKKKKLRCEVLKAHFSNNYNKETNEISQSRQHLKFIILVCMLQ